MKADVSSWSSNLPNKNVFLASQSCRYHHLIGFIWKIFTGNSRNHGFPHEIQGVPVWIFPFSQENQSDDRGMGHGSTPIYIATIWKGESTWIKIRYGRYGVPSGYHPSTVPWCHSQGMSSDLRGLSDPWWIRRAKVILCGDSIHLGKFHHDRSLFSRSLEIHGFL